MELKYNVEDRERLKLASIILEYEEYIRYAFVLYKTIIFPPSSFGYWEIVTN